MTINSRAKGARYERTVELWLSSQFGDRITRVNRSGCRLGQLAQHASGPGAATTAPGLDTDYVGVDDMTDAISRAVPAPTHQPKKQRTGCDVEGCTAKHFGQGFCHAHYARWRRNGSPTGGKLSPGTAVAFIRSVVENPPDHCVEFPYLKNERGYGRVYYRGKQRQAHRVALELATGRDEPDMHAAHAPDECHNPSCVNPRHPRWTTPQGNVDDKWIDGTMPIGQKAAGSKLTPEDVRAIRADTRPLPMLAELYRCTPQNIDRIKKRQTWRWLP